MSVRVIWWKALKRKTKLIHERSHTNLHEKTLLNIPKKRCLGRNDTNFAAGFALPFLEQVVSGGAEVQVFMKAAIKAFFRRIIEDLDLYIVRSRAIWTDDPKYNVVCLRNKIIDLVNDRISEVTGVTEPEELYLLAPGDDRYALVRIRSGLIIEGTYFERGWLDKLESACPDIRITPRMLEIQGNPYRITKSVNPQLAQLILKDES